jgi:hypothetical protein
VRAIGISPSEYEALPFIFVELSIFSFIAISLPSIKTLKLTVSFLKVTFSPWILYSLPNEIVAEYLFSAKPTSMIPDVKPSGAYGASNFHLPTGSFLAAEF